MDEPLVVNHANQIILGLGLATLVSAKQNILISIGNVDGVRVCGLILQAGPSGPGASVAPTLLEWGRDATSYPGDPNNPVLYMMFSPELEVQMAQSIPLLQSILWSTYEMGMSSATTCGCGEQTMLSVLSRTAAIDVVMEW